MVDGSEQAAAFRAAFDRGLLALIAAVRVGVENGMSGASPVTFALRCSLLAHLRMAEWFAELIVTAESVGGPAPTNNAPRQFHAPLGDRSPAIEEPRVPRRTGHDQRLPGKRPHP